MEGKGRGGHRAQRRSTRELERVGPVSGQWGEGVIQDLGQGLTGSGWGAADATDPEDSYSPTARTESLSASPSLHCSLSCSQWPRQWKLIHGWENWAASIRRGASRGHRQSTTASLQMMEGHRGHPHQELGPTHSSPPAQRANATHVCLITTRMGGTGREAHEGRAELRTFIGHL